MISWSTGVCPGAANRTARPTLRRFGGMKIPAPGSPPTGPASHILHTLFQTSIKYPTIKRFDEHFCLDLIVEDGRVRVSSPLTSERHHPLHQAKSVVLATGGAGRVYRYNTNGGIVTGDGMALAYRHGVPLRDMEFVGITRPVCRAPASLMTEGCRGEGGILLNKDGYRYLQDYGLGQKPGRPAEEQAHGAGSARPSLPGLLAASGKRPRDPGPHGRRGHLDLRHLGEKVPERASALHLRTGQGLRGGGSGKEPIRYVRPPHYTMGGIETDGKCATRLAGLYAAGECASVGLHGANRLGSNSCPDRGLRQGGR